VLVEFPSGDGSALFWRGRFFSMILPCCGLENLLTFLLTFDVRTGSLMLAPLWSLDFITSKSLDDLDL